MTVRGGYRHGGELHLSPRQRDVLKLIAEGKTNFEIAETLGIGYESVKSHVSEVLVRLGVDRREEAAAWWREERSLGRRATRLGAGILALLPRGAVLGSTAAAVAVLGAVLAATVLDRPDGAGPTLPATPTSLPSPTSERPSPTPAVSPTPTGPLVATHAAGTLTGQLDIDRILAAVESGDAAAIADLIHISQLPCEEPRTVQPQPLRCDDGVAPGTMKRGFWVIDVEGGLWPAGPALLAHLASLFSGRYQLVGVYERAASKTLPADRGGGEVGVLYWVRERLVSLNVHDGRITSWIATAYPTDGNLDPNDLSSWILAPP